MVLTLMLLLYMYVIGNYDATLEYNLAVKMMFNYGLDSNAAVIYEGMQKEAVPARMLNEEDRDHMRNG